MKNPIVQGWYADPESMIYDGKLYIYVTKSLPYEEQMNIDLVVSSDLEKFDIIHDILDMSTFPGTTRCVWAPSAIEKNGKYYVIFSTNGIKQDGEVGGLYIGVSDRPEGPFRNIYEDGRPFLNKFHNGAQPIDAHFYKENDAVYIYYGGWKHLNVCKLNEKMDGLVPLQDDEEEQFIMEIGKDGSLVRDGVRISHKKNRPEDIKYIYEGHEIAVHTLTHPNLLQIADDSEVVRQVEQDRLNLSQLCGYEVTGMAYPYGVNCYDGRILNLIQNKTGVEYARTAISTHKFELPTNCLEYHPSVYHHKEMNKMFELGEQFLKLETNEPQVLCVGGTHMNLIFLMIGQSLKNFYK